MRQKRGGDAMADDADVIVVGGGLAGLVAATEIADAGKRVIVVDQEGEQSLGGQAFWSFGGLFLVDSPEQRRLGIKDSFDLALQDWMGSAGFDRDEDLWPKRWAEAYVAFAAGEKRGWLRAMGHRIFPVVGWAERGGYDAMSHGNSVPRFHVSWGTGPGIVEPFERRAREAQASGMLSFRFRHRVDALTSTGDSILELFATDAQQFLMGYLPVVLFDNYKKYGVIAPTAWPTGPGFITKDKAAAVIELSKKGYR